MASLTESKSGLRAVQFVASDGSRKTIRVGRTPRKVAEQIRGHVEHLVFASGAGAAAPQSTAKWLSEISDDLHDKLARAGLVQARDQRQVRTLGFMLDAVFDNLDVKPSTRTRYRQSIDLLLRHFGADRDITTITPHDAELWRQFLVSKGYATSKINREVGLARMFFAKAVRWEWITRNPFDSVRGGRQNNPDRIRYISADDIGRVIDVCTSHDWRCIIALARYGGLRCPSEVLRVRWDDVYWDTHRLRVTSPKTEHHAGKGERVIPMQPRLEEILLDAFEGASERSEHVVGAYRDATSANLRTHMLRLIRKAGLEPWPKLFVNLRASMATDLSRVVGGRAYEQFMGHTQAIATAHTTPFRRQTSRRHAARCKIRRRHSRTEEASTGHRPRSRALRAV